MSLDVKAAAQAAKASASHITPTLAAEMQQWCSIPCGGSRQHTKKERQM
jgi:hypothetical protein